MVFYWKEDYNDIMTHSAYAVDTMKLIEFMILRLSIREHIFHVCSYPYFVGNVVKLLIRLTLQSFFLLYMVDLSNLLRHKFKSA